MIEFKCANDCQYIVLNYNFIVPLILYCLLFIVLDEFKLQIRNTVSSMKYDLDVITNRVVKLELKLDEVI